MSRGAVVERVEAGCTELARAAGVLRQEREDREKKERDQRAEQTISPVERVPDIARAEAREADEHAARPWRRVGRGWLAAAAALILATAVWYYGQTSQTNPPPATTASPRNDAPAVEQAPQTRSEPSQAPPTQSPARSVGTPVVVLLTVLAGDAGELPHAIERLVPIAASARVMKMTDPKVAMGLRRTHSAFRSLDNVCTRVVILCTPIQS